MSSTHITHYKNRNLKSNNNKLVNHLFNSNNGIKMASNYSQSPRNNHEVRKSYHFIVDIYFNDNDNFPFVIRREIRHLKITILRLNFLFHYLSCSIECGRFTL